MSTDAKVTKELIETLQDGEDGFARVAEKVADSDTPQLSDELRRLSEQRAQFRGELELLAREYGDNIDESGSAAGTVHRGWIALKDALTGSSPDAVLKAAVTGENHAVSEYDKALEDDISPTLRTVVERQRGEIVVARDKVSALADARS